MKALSGPISNEIKMDERKGRIEISTEAGKLALCRSRRGFWLEMDGRKSEVKKYVEELDPDLFSNEISDEEKRIMRKGALQLRLAAWRMWPDSGRSCMPGLFQIEGFTVIPLLNGEEDAKKTVCANEISESYAFQLVYIPCKIREEKKGNSEGKCAELPFLLYNLGGKRGYAPIHDNKIEILNQAFHVKTILKHPHGPGPEMVKKFLDGEAHSPKRVFQRIIKYLKAHVDLENEDDYIICAIWAIGTHFHQAFLTFPFIKFEGPPMCGKTTANYTMGAISFHPIFTPDVSDAAFYRLREGLNTTIVMDERDFTKRIESRFDDLLNNSFTRGGTVVRNVKSATGDISPEFFGVFGPFSFSGIQNLPGMSETRTLMIFMKRTLRAEICGNPPQPDREPAKSLRETLYLLRLSLGPKIAQIYSRLKPEQFGLSNRIWDMARPLIAVAKVFAPRTIPAIIGFVKRQGEEREEDLTERPEIKVLLALDDLVVGDDWYEVKDITEKVLELFEEDQKFWSARKTGCALRKLGFREKKKGGKSGTFSYLITRGRVDDWIRRLHLNGQNGGRAGHREMLEIKDISGEGVEGTRDREIKKASLKSSKINPETQLMKTSPPSPVSPEVQPSNIQTLKIPDVKGVCGYCWREKFEWKEGEFYERTGRVSEGICSVCGERPAEILVKFLLMEDEENDEGDLVKPEGVSVPRLNYGGGNDHNGTSNGWGIEMEHESSFSRRPTREGDRDGRPSPSLHQTR